MPEGMLTGYMYLKLHGLIHQVSYISRTLDLLETACGLPVTKSMEHGVYFDVVDHLNEEDFCEMCYDHLALNLLANI